MRKINSMPVVFAGPGLLPYLVEPILFFTRATPTQNWSANLLRLSAGLFQQSSLNLCPVLLDCYGRFPPLARLQVPADLQFPRQQRGPVAGQYPVHGLVLEHLRAFTLSFLPA
jgi:hypothetical protein